MYIKESESTLLLTGTSISDLFLNETRIQTVFWTPELVQGHSKLRY